MWVVIDKNIDIEFFQKKIMQIPSRRGSEAVTV